MRILTMPMKTNMDRKIMANTLKKQRTVMTKAARNGKRMSQRLQEARATRLIRANPALTTTRMRNIGTTQNQVPRRSDLVREISTERRKNWNVMEKQDHLFYATERESPAADIASPKPTVRTGARHTSTGVNKKVMLPTTRSIASVQSSVHEATGFDALTVTACSCPSPT